MSARSGTFGQLENPSENGKLAIASTSPTVGSKYVIHKVDPNGVMGLPDGVNRKQNDMEDGRSQGYQCAHNKDGYQSTKSRSSNPQSSHLGDAFGSKACSIATTSTCDRFVQVEEAVTQTINSDNGQANLEDKR